MNVSRAKAVQEKQRRKYTRNFVQGVRGDMYTDQKKASETIGYQGVYRTRYPFVRSGHVLQCGRGNAEGTILLRGGADLRIWSNLFPHWIS
jgi:hypothetical protein